MSDTKMEEEIEVTCVVCGNPFFRRSTQGRKNTCSLECKRIHTKQLELKRYQDRVAKCELCGAPIIGKSWRYCSTECRQKAALTAKRKTLAKKAQKKKKETKALTVNEVMSIAKIVYEKHGVWMQYGQMSKYTDAEKIMLKKGKKPWK